MDAYGDDEVDSASLPRFKVVKGEYAGNELLVRISGAPLFASWDSWAVRSAEGHEHR
ncbi:hypothetical protein [Streptomyces sp. NPDC050564]|uniref:hypothetical protein n=1 Tax=Streptomyces sp. NPDC050564 TaxID=3365631 RepID=UPI0037A8361F